MKFRCERDTLVEALTTAGRAVSNRSTGTTASSGIRVGIEGNRLSVVGTDLDLTVRVSVEAIGLDNGSCVAPARLTADIVRALEPGAVTFEASEDEVEMSAARSRFVVKSYPVDDFPVLPEPREDQVSFPAVVVAEAMRQVVRAASNDDARPLLTGVLVAKRPEGIRLVATDSYRLALRDITGAASLPGGTEQLLVPARALAELQRRLPGQSSKDEADKEVGFSVGELDATFSTGEVTLTTRLLDGKYPDYEQLIPAGYPNKLRVGKDPLLDALRRVRLLVRDNTTPVRLSMRAGSLELTVVSSEVGHASEDLDADFEGEELTVAFNPSYLIDGVEAVLGDEVVLETVDATKPATVRSPEHDDYKYLLMPVRVS
ncbi:MAG TPA: DNA polymerase III subunit beta [Acidimicrobiales bacterium]|nr:DNA polymerase III subunit beta [Acidimicrobiales bacterium]